MCGQKDQEGLVQYMVGFLKAESFHVFHQGLS